MDSRQSEQAQLPFIKNLKALKKFAKDHPYKLRMRPHPSHPRRLQVNAADVLRLAMEHDDKQFEALDGPGADKLPSISDRGFGALAERVARVRANKGK